MTPTDQAARWLADVPRYNCTASGDMEQDSLGGSWYHDSEVIAAIARHLAPGDDAVLIDALLNEPGFDKDWREAAAARIAALTATVERRERMHKSLSKRFAEANSARNAAEADNATLRDRLARMEGALRNMPKTVRHTTVCQGPKWPDDRPGVWVAALTACENAVQQAVDAALTDGGTDERG